MDTGVPIECPASVRYEKKPPRALQSDVLTEETP